MESPTGVFLSAFLAGTILPFSSKIVLSAIYGAGDSSAILIFLVETTVNVLGALVN